MVHEFEIGGCAGAALVVEEDDRSNILKDNY
jgi:hypothetical protein